MQVGLGLNYLKLVTLLNTDIGFIIQYMIFKVEILFIEKESIYLK